MTFLPFRNRAAFNKRQRSLELAEASAVRILTEMAAKNSRSFVPIQVGAAGYVDHSHLKLTPPPSPAHYASIDEGYTSIDEGGAFKSADWQSFEKAAPVTPEPVGKFVALPEPSNKRAHASLRLPSGIVPAFGMDLRAPEDEGTVDPAEPAPVGTLDELSEPSSKKPRLLMDLQSPEDEGTIDPAEPSPVGTLDELPEPSSEKPRLPSRLPSRNNPMDPNFDMSLHAPEDEGLVNPAHAEVRKRVLAVRRTEWGSVYFQCRCCEHLPRRERKPQSVITPEKVEGLYQSFVRFMMKHVPACPHVPREIKDLDPRASQNVKASGIKKYWAVSAYNRGLRNGGVKGIVYGGGESP